MPLHAGRHNDHVYAVPAAAQHFQKIAHRRAGRTGDERNPSRKLRQRPFALRREQAFGRKLLVQLTKFQLQRTKTLQA